LGTAKSITFLYSVVVCRIPGFGNSSTVEWLDPSMRAFSGYFANIADHLGNTGCRTNKMPPDPEFPDSEEVELGFWFSKATDAERRAGNC
jgi:hypothetical protein